MGACLEDLKLPGQGRPPSAPQPGWHQRPHWVTAKVRSLGSAHHKACSGHWGTLTGVSPPSHPATVPWLGTRLPLSFPHSPAPREGPEPTHRSWKEIPVQFRVRREAVVGSVPWGATCLSRTCCSAVPQVVQGSTAGPPGPRQGRTPGLCHPGAPPVAHDRGFLRGLGGQRL